RVAPARHGSASRREVSVRSVVEMSEFGLLNPEAKAKMEALVDRFKMADVDGNGTIDREELRNLLESMENGEVYLLSQHWLPEDELDRVMETYDVNKDGVISFEEFKNIVYDGMLLEGALNDYESAFKAVDLSGNGTIGATELGQLFAKLGNPMSPEKLVELMQVYDKDDSGQIEFNEFLFMFRNHLLDLKAMTSYMGDDMSGSGTGAIVDVSGDARVSMIEKPPVGMVYPSVEALALL
ncbi:putative calcium-binding protein CML25, partial [Tetrabaena socialis]